LRELITSKSNAWKISAREILLIRAAVLAEEHLLLNGKHIFLEILLWSAISTLPLTILNGLAR